MSPEEKSRLLSYLLQRACNVCRPNEADKAEHAGCQEALELAEVVRRE